MSGQSVPLDQFVLKIHSRCDLACDHCYVYEAADQSWRGQPVFISDEVVSQAARRIVEHARAHALPAVQIVLHGGEPLLAGPKRLGRIITEFGQALQGVCDLDLRIHTNGIQLKENICDLFAEYGVKVGISLDGDRVANDRHRRYADGRSSYEKVMRAITLLRERYPDLYAGLLCTIDVANDPLVVYESLMALRPPRIDFLLPHATWDHPPRRERPGSEYADWLTAIYDRWIADGQPSEIRTFGSIISTLHGGPNLTEALGLGPTRLAVIETDGSYEQVDSLKVAFEGAPETGMNVFSHTLDLVAEHPGIVAREQGLAGLCQTCRECPVVGSCGGGLYTHRYREGNGFANPSVYCSDLFALISHISRHQRPRQAISKADFEALAAGRRDGAAVASLRQAQRSLQRGLLGAVYRTAVKSPVVPESARAQLGVAWSVLTSVDRDQPAALSALLGYPYLRAWAVRCLEQLGTAASWPGDDDHAYYAGRLSADLGQLGAIAVAAAVRSRMNAVVTVPVLDSAVHLPSLGRLVLGPGFGPQPAENSPKTAAISVISNALIIRIGDSCWTLGLTELLSGQPDLAAAPGNSCPADWQPVRMLRADGRSVSLDDIDPYRDCYPWPAAPRLTAAELARWQVGFELAWQEVRRVHPGFAPGLAAGLSTLTPLLAPAGHPEVSAVARKAPGAVAVSLPADPVTLAELLIRENQRAKLGAILDLLDLYDRTDDRFFAAPWGEEKLQIDGLLQGAYTHLAITGFWLAQQQRAEGPAADLAGRRLTECQAHTSEAIDILLGSGALTPLGTRFAELMRGSAKSAAPRVPG
jgi:uncharacterized protein